MNLSSLNVDVLLHLMEFVKPVDCFNLILSGMLKGFENVNKGIIPHERYSEHFTCDVNGKRILFLPRIYCFEIELGLRRDDTCQLEIR